MEKSSVYNFEEISLSELENIEIYTNQTFNSNNELQEFYSGQSNLSLSGIYKKFISYYKNFKNQSNKPNQIIYPFDFTSFVLFRLENDNIVLNSEEMNCYITIDAFNQDILDLDASIETYDLATRKALRKAIIDMLKKSLPIEVRCGYFANNKLNIVMLTNYIIEFQGMQFVLGFFNKANANSRVKNEVLRNRCLLYNSILGNDDVAEIISDLSNVPVDELI